MSKVYFGSNIKANNNSLTGDTFKGNFKNNLTHVYTMPNGLTNISSLFYGCSNLKTVGYELEDGLIDISNVFYGCKNFSKDIQIPYSVENASNAFRGSNVKNAIFLENGNKANTLDLHIVFINVII